MSTSMRSLSPVIALAFLLLPASARVIWTTEEFDPAASSSLLQPRDATTCGGDSSLNYCGGNLPSGFCCSSAYTCLALSTSASVQAAICCPDGENCERINPISCDTSLQNTTITQLHADPPQKLKTCGNACCPMGYDCQNGQCIATVAPSPPGSKPTSTSTSSPSTATSTSSGSTSSATSSPSSAATSPLADQSSPSTGSDFNGKSFAAGFVPGIAVGAIIAACLILLFYRRKHGHQDSYLDEKGNIRDTLTDLEPLEYRRPTMHGRSISEPVTDPSSSHRTDFLRGTSSQGSDGTGMIANGYIVDVRSPASDPKTPRDSPPKVKALFSRSPFMTQYPSTPPSTQAPIPAHLKRGTLSFKISPVRALKKQKSTHSLRRQMIDASAGADITRSNSRRKPRPDASRSRSASTETIQVLMPSNVPYTPERPRQHQLPEHIQTLGSTTYQPPSSSTPSEWATTTTDTSSPDSPQPQVTYASSSRYPSDVQGAYTTPTRPPVPRLPNAAEMPLGSPYTPTNVGGNGKGKVAGGGGGGPVMSGGLGVERSVSRRDTTFSAMMERAGLRRSDFGVGGGKGR